MIIKMIMPDLSANEAEIAIVRWLIDPGQPVKRGQPLVEVQTDKAAEGISVEVIDVRNLSPFDFDTIGASVRKTGRVVIVEEEPKTGGVGAELSASVAERFGGGLKAPVVRVASPDVPVPFAPVLENAFRPGPARIVEGVRQIIKN